LCRFDSLPPFDEPFLIRVVTPDVANTVQLRWGPTQRDLPKRGGARPRTYQMSSPTVVRSRADTIRALKEGKHVFEVDRLDPYRTYMFVLEYLDGQTPRSNVIAADTVITTTNASYKDRFDLDFGVGWSPRPGPRFLGGTSNVHIYAVPINPREDPADYEGLENVWKRVSLFAGLTLVRFDAKDEVTDLFTLGNLTTGLAFRLQVPNGRADFLNFFRLHGGAMVFRQDDPNPTVTRLKVKASPLVGLGMDFEVKDFIGPLVGIFGLK
jgi:hypothetical protein